MNKKQSEGERQAWMIIGFLPLVVARDIGFIPAIGVGLFLVGLVWVVGLFVKPKTDVRSESNQL